MSKLFTIGYGNRKPDEFFALIPDGAVVIDVRAYPTCKWQFSYREHGLRAQLCPNGEQRYFPIQSLGNVSGTADTWQSPDEMLAHAWMDLIADGIRQGITYCLLCAELDPNRCHRRFVAEEIARRVPGCEIVHL